MTPEQQRHAAFNNLVREFEAWRARLGSWIVENPSGTLYVSDGAIGLSNDLEMHERCLIQIAQISARRAME